MASGRDLRIGRAPPHSGDPYLFRPKSLAAPTNPTIASGFPCEAPMFT